MFKSFFSYVLTFNSLGPAATQTQTKNILADADFEWIKGEYDADLAGAAVTDSSRVIPLVNILITDTASGYSLSDVAVPLSSLFGTGQIPFILPIPYKFRRAGTISVQATNISAASTYNIRLVLSGAKSFPK